MPTQLKNETLKTATPRLKLEVRKKPYWFAVAPGVSLGYRRCEGFGTWSVRFINSAGKEQVARIGAADDFEAADGRTVLTFVQAQDLARTTARTTEGGAPGKAPLTVAQALDAYEADLLVNQADPANARRVKFHLPPALASRLLTALDADELLAWRNGLLAKMSEASVNRVRTGLRAALNLAAKRNAQLNPRAWKVGLEGLPDTNVARNVYLTNEQVWLLVDCAYAINAEFGLLVRTLAETGARTSQVARLTVADLQTANARVMMPSSRKGGRRKKAKQTSVPVSAELAALLAASAQGRPSNAPLLTYLGEAWGCCGEGYQQRRFFQRAAAAAGLRDEITPVALRHSSIIRALLANVPHRLVAASHDTGIGPIERNYTHHIAQHADAVARAGLITRPTANVVPMRRHQEAC